MPGARKKIITDENGDRYLRWESIPEAEVVAEKRREESDAAIAKRLREVRTSLLFATDWTQLPDVPLTPDTKQAMRDYRTALRDLPTQTGWPRKVEWPVDPLGDIRIRSAS